MPPIFKITKLNLPKKTDFNSKYYKYTIYSSDIQRIGVPLKRLVAVPIVPAVPSI